MSLQPYGGNPNTQQPGWQQPPGQQAPPPQQQQQAPAGPQTLAELFKVLIPGMIKGFIKTLPVTIVMALAIIALNTFIVVVKNDGFNKWNASLPWWMTYIISREGAKGGATLFWTFLGMMTSMFFTKLLSGQLPGTFANFFKTPSFISTARREAGESVGVQLLAGSGLAWLVGAFAANPLVCLQGTVMVLGSIARRQQSLAMTIMRLGHRDSQRILKKPQPHTLIPFGKLVFVLTGMSLGFVTALVMPKLLPSIWGYLLAIVLIVLAFVLALGGNNKAPGFAVFLLIALHVGLVVTPLFAHDGGWSENGSNFSTWAASGGAPVAVGMALPPALGWILGIGLGALVGGFTGIDWDPILGPGDEPPPPPPQYPPEIEWTGPDGVTRLLTFDPKYGGYINNLTGGFVDPNDVAGWQQSIGDNLQQVADWRARNDYLQSTGQDSMSQALAAIQADAAQRQQLLTTISKMERGVFEGKAGLDGLLKNPGDPGNIMDSLRTLADQVSSGDKVDYDKLNATMKLYKNTVSGAAMTEDQMPKPDGLWENTKDMVSSSFNQMTNTTNDKGEFSWLSLGGRVGLDILTLGTAEGLFGAKGYVDAGGNSALKGAGLVMLENAVMIGLGLGAAKVIGGIAKAAPAVVGELAGEGAEALVNAAKNGSSLAKNLVNLGEGASKVGSSLYEGGGKQILNVLKGGKEILTTEIRGPWSRPPGPVPPARPPVTATQIGSRNTQFIRNPTVDVAEHLKGIPTTAQEHIQDVANTFGKKIDIRASNPDVAARIAEGAHPKPPTIHNKTISAIDQQLGAKGQKGMVGHFKPKIDMQKFDKLTRPEQQALVDKFQGRWKEYINNNKAIRSNPDFLVKNGVIHNTQSGMGYTGDVDVAHIRNLDGSLPTPQEYNAVMNELINKPTGVTHNPQMTWDYRGDSRIPTAPGLASPYELNQAIDRGVLSKIQLNTPGSEPLITFTSGAPPEATFIMGGQLR